MMSNQGQSHLDRQVVALGRRVRSCSHVVMMLTVTVVVRFALTEY